jgi:hypothetical protein
MDVRWVYWEAEAGLLDRPRPELVPHVFPGNRWLSAGQRNRKSDFYVPQFTSHLADYHIVESNAGMFPLYLAGGAEPNLLTDTDQSVGPNLTDRASQYLAALKVSAEDIFFHTLAILHAPAYRDENAGALRQDWPRIPLPEGRERLEASAALGRRVAALLDTENPVPGVTTGEIRPDLRALGPIVRVGGGALDPAAGDLAITAGWGHAGQGGVTMPGKGKVVEGPDGYDVYLNDRAYWARVPARVWNYTIGGYQVIKKWLSYRERALLGRDLTVDEAKYVSKMVRRIAALVALEAELDENYHAVKAATYPWPRS